MESLTLTGLLGSATGRDRSRLLDFDDLESMTSRTLEEHHHPVATGSSLTQVLPAPPSTSEMPNQRLHPGIEAVVTSIGILAEDPDLREADDGSLQQALLKLCQGGGPLAIAALRESYHRGQMTASGYREVLARLGEIEHGPSQEARWYILCSGLAEQEPVVRSGASLGLVDLRDERGLQALGRAAEFERIPLLKRRMELALQELQRCTQE